MTEQQASILEFVIGLLYGFSFGVYIMLLVGAR
jgi:hypothetical protein